MRDAVLQLACVQRARERPQTKPLIVFLILPYVYILLLGVGFLGMTAIASLLALSIIFIHRVLQSMSDDGAGNAGAWLVAGQAISHRYCTSARAGSVFSSPGVAVSPS